jgi:DnaJ family protein A protein 2
MVRDTKLYDILQISSTANNVELKKAYKKLILIHHPDKNGGDDTRFKEIDSAYKILSNESSREYYDKTGSINPNKDQGNGNPFGDIFSHFSSFFTPAPRQTRDTCYNLQETVGNLYSGIKKKIKISRQVLCITCKGTCGTDIRVCSKCNGHGIILQQQNAGNMCIQTQQPCPLCKSTGKNIINKCNVCTGTGYQQKEEEIEIEIPAGAKDGYVIKIIGMSNQVFNVATGNLNIVIKELHHPTFKRKDNDIHIDAEIPLSTALLGGTIDIAHLDDTILQIDIPKGRVIKPNDNLVVENRGMPIMGQPNKYGDFIITFNIVFPSNEWAKKVDKTLVERIFQS